jgi:hypothetical protein
MEDGKIELTGRRGRRCKQILDGPKEIIRWWKLKGDCLENTL